jgi:hypothetical protein
LVTTASFFKEKNNPTEYPASSAPQAGLGFELELETVQKHEIS